MTDSEEVNYSYSSTGQLTSETSSLTGTNYYSYDDNGALVKKENSSSSELVDSSSVEIIEFFISPSNKAYKEI